MEWIPEFAQISWPIAPIEPFIVSKDAISVIEPPHGGPVFAPRYPFGVMTAVPQCVTQTMCIKNQLESWRYGLQLFEVALGYRVVLADSLPRQEQPEAKPALPKRYGWQAANVALSLPYKSRVHEHPPCEQAVLYQHCLPDFDGFQFLFLCACLVVQWELPSMSRRDRTQLAVSSSRMQAISV